jgi:hypothetical protein
LKKEKNENYNDNVCPITCNKGEGGGKKYSSTVSLTSTIDGVNDEGFTPGKET